MFFGVGGAWSAFGGADQVVYSVGFGAFPNRVGVVSAVEVKRCWRSLKIPTLDH